MKRQIVKASQVQKNENYTKFTVVGGVKVKLYWWTELNCYYYWTKNGQVVPATIL